MTNHLRTGLLVSPLLLLIAHYPLRADNESGEDLHENDILEHVQVTVTRTSRRDIDIASAVNAIDGETILEHSPDVIAEMLRAEPGTFFQQTTPGQGIPIIRGLKGSQVLHMVDGMRLNNALFRAAPNQYLGLVDSFATQRMEVVRGSQGSLYGADAMGGVLNILTQEPGQNVTHRKQAQGQPGAPGATSLYGSYDSVDNGWVLSARTQVKKQGWAFVGGASFQDHSSRKAGDGKKLVPSAYQSKAADLKFVINSSERSSLLIAAQVMEQPSTPRYDELVPGYGQDEPTSEQFLFEPNRRSFIHARFRLDGQSAWFDQFETHVARQVITDDRQTQEFGNSEIVTENNSSTLDGISLQFNSSMASGEQFVWGAEYPDPGT
jgi:outer membrane cobalamin receptor